MRPPITTEPTTTPVYMIPQCLIFYEHGWCQLYELANLRRRVVIGRALFYPVGKIFNHAVKYTYHIERALRSHSRLRVALSLLTYISGNEIALTTTRYLLTTLRESAQDIASLIDTLRSQHTHLIPTGILISDRDPIDNL